MPVDAESDATGRTSDNNFICLEVCTPVGGDRPQFLVWHECASLHSLQLMENERISQLSYLASRTQKIFFGLHLPCHGDPADNWRGDSHQLAKQPHFTAPVIFRPLQLPLLDSCRSLAR